MKTRDNLTENSGSSRSIPVKLDKYGSLVRLKDPYDAPDPASACETEREAIVDNLLTHLKSESVSGQSCLDPSKVRFSYLEKRRMLQEVLTVRRPGPLPSGFHEQLDRLLQREVQDRGVIDSASLPRIAQTSAATSYGASDRCALWRGDITTLRIDAIVNAANAYLLGCFQPFHACIDNVIHAAAGPRLRDDCHAIMELQGGIEHTGRAKVTRAYNLPCRYVLHTVGPILDSVAQGPSPEQAEQLAACYLSCLDLAAIVSNIRSVAFCCISTGVFGFPQEPAARIALRTVEHWLDTHRGTLDLVVFNVFRLDDLRIYERLLNDG